MAGIERPTGRITQAGTRSQKLLPELHNGTKSTITCGVQTTLPQSLRRPNHAQDHFATHVPQVRSHRSAGIAGLVAPASRVLGANDRIRLAFIGVANRGGQLIDAFSQHADMQIVALCDVNKQTLASAKEKVGGNVETEADFRRLLDRKDIDAVVIATPDHWHAIQAVSACDAGKDVYVEKPLSITIHEGRRWSQRRGATSGSCRWVRTAAVRLSTRPWPNACRLRILARSASAARIA